MKTKKTLLTTLVVLVATMAFASEKVKLHLVPTDSEKTLIAFNSETPTPYQVTIKNNKNEVLYYYQSKKPKYTFRGNFDFSKLEPGKYHLSVNYGNNSLNSELTVTKDKVQHGTVVHAKAPHFNQNKDLLVVSYINVAQKPVHVNIYKQGRHIMDTKLGTGVNIQKRFDFSNIEKGEYKVVLTDYYRDHSYMVSK